MAYRLTDVALMSLVAGSGVAFGHHSPSRFDLTRVETLTGIVSRYDFTNPHVYVYLDTIDADGMTTTWELEASSTPNLVRRGWGPDSLRVGEQISAVVNPPRDAGGHTARAQSIRWGDGRTLAVRGGGSVVPAPETLARASSLAGSWLGRYGLAQVGTDLAEWPLTPKGRTAQASYDGSQNPHIDCVPVAAPSLMMYSNVYTIDIEDDRVTIHIEWMDSQRVVHLGGGSALGAVPRTNQGYSVGHWDGRDLIVETRRFADNGAGNAFEIPSGAQKSLQERFALSGDGREIRYSFVLEDPEYLSQAVQGEAIWDYRPDLAPLPNQCDPEVARRFLEGTNRER